ncbi:nucleotide-binding domain-containing protein [Bacillus amyloliquefaciens]|uniref:nucleotide-binding domain-containing protein n=1 Tax=Bacillus amyloliquefaciens TaxID=1390 RepID=UPI002FF576A4
MLSQSFESFAENLQLDNTEDMETKFKSITKRLNKKYYESSSETDHAEMVGSIGRHTAIKTVSDLDMLFVLPQPVFDRFNSYESNGQSALLQEVKEEIKKRYPKTIVRGDGQVVVVTFTNFEIEICPAFLNSNDGSYTYPDSNQGGKWRRTDPLVEIGESEYMISETDSHFKYVCQMVRAWKNNIGFKMGGLLIDSLVHKFFRKNTKYLSATFDDYLNLFIDLFGYLKDLNEDQTYWRALGSRQPVYNKDKRFIKKAKKAYNKLKDFTSECEDLYDVLKELFGRSFPVPETIQKAEDIRYAMSYSPTEQFIEDLFPVDIKYSLKIDSEVSQDGFRTMLLRALIKNKKPLMINKSLHFFIKKNEVEEKELDFKVYWKVKNRGEEAKKKGQLRGQIVKGGNKKIEHSRYKGEHYVECYIIHNGVCVARDHIKVPISTAPVHA